MFNKFLGIESSFSKISFQKADEENISNRGRLLVGVNLKETRVNEDGNKSEIVAVSNVLIFGVPLDIGETYFDEDKNPMFENIKNDNLYQFIFEGEVDSKIFIDSAECNISIQEAEDALLSLILSSIKPQIESFFTLTRFKAISLPVL